MLKGWILACCEEGELSLAKLELREVKKEEEP